MPKLLFPFFLLSILSIVLSSHPFTLTFNNIHNGYSLTITGTFDIHNNHILLTKQVDVNEMQSENDYLFDHIDSVKRDVIPAAADGTMTLSKTHLISEISPEQTQDDQIEFIFLYKKVRNVAVKFKVPPEQEQPVAKVLQQKHNNNESSDL